jgi:hypothetical protein
VRAKFVIGKRDESEGHYVSFELLIKGNKNNSVVIDTAKLTSDVLKKG